MKCLNGRISKLLLINILYLIILLLGVFLPNNGISDYNWLVLLVVTSIYLCLIKHANVYYDIIICCSSLCIVSIYKHPIYTIFDCLLIFFVFASLQMGIYYTVRPKEVRCIKNIYLLYIVLSLIGIFNSSLYVESKDLQMRYVGLFHAGNMSASIFAILEIAVWEIEKSNKGRLAWLLFLIASYFFYAFASLTRSLWFFLPYWIYQIVHRSNVIIVFLLLCVGLLYLFPISEDIEGLLRLEADASSMTRAALYEQLLSGILDYGALLPHGSNAARDMIVSFTDDPSYTPHNDILKFIYDWGIIFYAFCIMLVIRLKKCISINIEFVMIMLAVISCGLHNMMFSVYIWIPITTILMVRRTCNKIDLS